ESTANHEKILKLAFQIDRMYNWLNNKAYQKFKSFNVSTYSHLGELQGSFQTFAQHFREFISYLPEGFYHKKRQVLKQEMNYNRLLLKKLKERKQIQTKMF